MTPNGERGRGGEGDAHRAGIEPSPPRSASHVQRPALHLADYLLALASALLAAALYLRTLAPGLLGGDSGEFQFAAWLGGFAHPTGYPLYLLLGYLWTHVLPVGDPAWRMNVFSALWGAAAIGLLYLLALRVSQAGQRLRLPTPSSAGEEVAIRLLALVAAFTFAFTPTFWSQAVVAEVYTLNTVLVIAIVLGLVTWAAQPAERRSIRPLYATAFLFGLSLAHHRTTILWVPAIVVFLWFAGRELRSHASPMATRSLRRLVALFLLVLLPLLLYLYIPLAAQHVSYRQVIVGPDQRLDLYIPSLAGFLDHVTGREFGAEFRTPAAALLQIEPSLRRFAGEMTWIGLALGLLGIAWLARRSRSLLALTGLGFLALFGFNLFYGIGDIGVYFISLYMLWALWIALGVAGLAAAGKGLVMRGLPRSSAGPSWARSLVFLFPCLFALLFPLYLLQANFAQIDRSRDNEARASWQAILDQPIPRGAILVTNDRDEMMPFWYMQYAEGAHTDLTGLFPLIRSTPEWADVGMVAGSALRSGRPVLLIKEMPGLEVKFRTQPAGALVRVLAPAAENPPARPADARFGDADPGGAIRLLGFDIEPEMLAPGDTATIRLHWQPLHPLGQDYTTFVHLVNAEGRVVGASDHRPGGVYYPTSLWKPGEVLVDAHSLALALDLGRPPYALEVGLYTGEKAPQHLGQPQRVGAVARVRPPDAAPAGLANRSDAVFGGQIALLGYEKEMQSDRLALKLYWQALAAPSADYTIFVHLLDKNGKIVAQFDGQPVGGELPTSAWPRGYVLGDTIVLNLPSSLPSGTYRLIAGLYNATTGVRLPLAGGQGDSVSFGEVAWPPAR